MWHAKHYQLYVYYVYRVIVLSRVPHSSSSRSIFSFVEFMFIYTLLQFEAIQINISLGAYRDGQDGST